MSHECRKKFQLLLFPVGIDRAATVAFFLGAVVPLLVLGSLTENSALATLGSYVNSKEPLPKAALVMSIGALSLLCFLNLRRVMISAVRENRMLAFYDSLTGLPNRAMYRDRLDHAIDRARRSNQLVAACFVDLDGFKRVNDTLGHDAGDRLLVQVAARLSSTLRIGDMIARSRSGMKNEVSRLGGDEFSFLLYGIESEREAGRIVERVVSRLAEPFDINGREVFSTASVGVALYPQHGDDPATLLRNADSAMYAAKHRGRNNYQVYTHSMNESAARKFDIEEQLRHALETDELFLEFQPICDATTGAIRSAETLLRWENAELGKVSPEEFVPVAEDSGLILPIGEWVLRRACEQALAWDEAGAPGLRVAVNMSGIQVRVPGMVELVRDILSETGLEPARLELEITESTIMWDDAVTAATIHDLHELGVSLVLDDFGTGYSSLSYLRRFPVRTVKIDCSFVRELPDNADDLAVTAAIIAMSHNLRMTVVAEGVETEEQVACLRKLGCDELQGYLLGRPVRGEDLAERLVAGGNALSSDLVAR